MGKKQSSRRSRSTPKAVLRLPDLDQAVTFDTEGYVSVGTRLGVKVCDPSGNLTEIIRPPGNGGVSNVFFAGRNLQWLYVTDGDRIFRRYVKRRGVTSRRGG